MDDAGHAGEYSQAADAHAHRSAGEGARPQHGHTQGCQQHWHGNTEHPERPGGDVVQHAAGGAGDAKPLAQADHDGERQHDECPAGAAVVSARGPGGGR